jgi:hypothetical protein
MASGFSGCRFCGGRGCLACAGERKRTIFEDQKPHYDTIKDAGLVAKCSRCGVPVKVATARRADAEILRLSKTTDGVCANCAVTQFLYNTYPANSIIDERGPEMLLSPGIGEAFISSGLMDRADMDIREVDWKAVVANWDLPVKIAKDPRNPYRMGEAKDAKRRRAMFPIRQTEEEQKAGISSALTETFGGDFDVEINGGSIIARKRERPN